MITLTNTTHILEVITGSASDIDVFVAYADHTTSGATLGDQQTLITTATTTTIVSAPAASTQRQIKHMIIRNTSATSNLVTVQKDISGTDYELFEATLAQNEQIVFVDGNGWAEYNSNGQILVANQPTEALYNNRYVPTGMLYENINRNTMPEVNTALLTSGRLSLEAIYLPAGVTITNISFFSATTAAGTPANQLFGIFDNNRNLLMSTNNDTTTAWAANSIKTLALTATYTTTYAGLHYLGIMVTATTVPTIKGFTAAVGGQLANAGLALRGTSNTGLTTALPATANAPAAVTTSAWCAVS